MGAGAQMMMLQRNHILAHAVNLTDNVEGKDIFYMKYKTDKKFGRNIIKQLNIKAINILLCTAVTSSTLFLILRF